MPIALVTGASRGVGRGVALGLNEAGFKVYVTGRKIESAELPSSVVRMTCDHTDDAQTRAVFDRISDAGDEIDVLVNSAWGGYERMSENGEFTWGRPFWQQPDHRWFSMMDAGVRAAFVASACAARGMTLRRRGLIVNISFWAAQKHIGNTIYGISKAATDKMTRDCAHELRDFGVTVLSLYPGLVRTESVLEAAKGGWLKLTNSESPEFIGRVIAALWAESELSKRSGNVVVAAQAARELGVADIDGASPDPLSLDKV